MATHTAVEQDLRYGEGSVREVSAGRWMISYNDAQGVRRRKSFSTEAKARKALAMATALRDTGHLPAVESKVRVDELAADYQRYADQSKPKSAYWISLVWSAHLKPMFGGMRAARISSDHLQQYIAARLEAKAATSTINRELAVFKAMFRLAAQADPPKINRVPRFPEKLREPDARKGFVTDEQYEKLQAACKHDWLRALLAVGYNYGFRKGELLGLRVFQVDLKARSIHLVPGSTKNDAGRTVAMTGKVHDLLAVCVKGKKSDDAVFTWPNGAHVEDFRGTWKALTKAAGLPGLLVHDLRRSAVRRMIRRGISKVVAKKLSGHKTDSVFDRYDIVDEKDLQDAAAKLE